MSVLSFPRLYFSGYESWDPNVTNNLPSLWDPVAVRLVFPAGVNASTYQRYVIDRVIGDWNVYGSHACDFVQYQQSTTTITGGSTGSGTITDDPIVGQPISIPGRLVDLNSLVADTSQYFFEEFSVGTAIRAPRSQRMHSRFLNFSRNLNVDQDPRIQIAGVASVAWQTAFPKATLQLEEGGSPLLTAFAQAMQQANVLGLMVRFVSYRTLYFQNGVFNDVAEQPRDAAALHALYAQGKMFSNPAYSVAAGSIGLWLENELASIPGGRYLVPNQTDDAGNPTGLGPVVAELHSNVLSLDFGSAIPETDYDLDKQDFGTLTVQAGGTPIASIAPAQYARDAYQATAGIIDVPLDSSPSGLLSIAGTLAGEPISMYQEAALTAQTDQKNFYLDEGESAAVSVYVSSLGAPAAAGTLVQVAQYGQSETGPAIFGPPLVVGAGGSTGFTVPATNPGFSFYRFQPYEPGEPTPMPPPAIDSMVDFYCGARTLPFDDALNRNTPDSALTWSFVYNQILQVYDLNPAAVMTALGFGLSSQATWDTPQSAQSILTHTSKAAFETLNYMPITRDLSNGMRALLQRWCALVIAGTPQAGPPAPPMAAVRRLMREA